MFERGKPSATPFGQGNLAQTVAACDISKADLAASESHIADDVAQTVSLRSIEWGELTARLSAARDLRQLLRADGVGKATDENLDFADAAAKFFGANEEDERGVNPNALEGRKASSGMYENVKSAQEADPSRADHIVTDSRAIAPCDPGDAKEEQ